MVDISDTESRFIFTAMKDPLQDKKKKKAKKSWEHNRVELN